jgi:hypothetical protein
MFGVMKCCSSSVNTNRSVNARESFFVVVFFSTLQSPTRCTACKFNFCSVFHHSICVEVLNDLCGTICSVWNDLFNVTVIYCINGITCSSSTRVEAATSSYIVCVLGVVVAVIYCINGINCSSSTRVEAATSSYIVCVSGVVVAASLAMPTL